MGDYLSLALLGALALLLVSAGIEDVRTREIANWKNALIALLAPAWWWASGLGVWPGAAIQLGVALLVFVVFVGAFALGQMGGGDVKLIGALALWLPPMPLMWMLVVMSLAGGALTLVMLAERWWRPAERPLEIPYGVAIAIAGLLSLHEPIINQLR
ncbi:prepilin peptidase [Sphingomonas cannabina]|uniref:A24 family peptidase n=1 Tax=Sphingomonas cannabina TaxID=2899123 RepID=UPI001F1AE22E|nr:prepilin peptidase [Sphingomonas cannabina]UIJ44545.1 prepilin peptidase [Sphingomonas cannabina]